VIETITKNGSLNKLKKLWFEDIKKDKSIINRISLNYLVILVDTVEIGIC
jgi:hypothetical protein